MKRLLLACICLLFCIGGWAKEVNIEWREPAHEDREIDRRSISITPVATHDEGTIFIYFPILIESFQVTVKDATGGIVYINVVAEPSKCQAFDIGSLIAGGEYFLEVEIGGQSYCGNFSI